jgi:hypothetical protein
MRATSASTADIQDLLADVMNWQPRGGFFSPDTSSFGGEGPSSPLMLSPGLLDVLSKS